MRRHGLETDLSIAPEHRPDGQVASILKHAPPQFAD